MNLRRFDWKRERVDFCLFVDAEAAARSADKGDVIDVLTIRGGLVNVVDLLVFVVCVGVVFVTLPLAVSTPPPSDSFERNNL